MMTTIHTQEQLKIALKISETHGRAYARESYNTPWHHKRQIEPGYLAISVSPKKVKDAVRVYDIFLSRMIQEGYTVDLESATSARKPSSAIIVEGKAFSIRVKEKYAYLPGTGGIWTSQTSAPTGVLTLEVYGIGSDKPARVLTASNDAEWEMKANDIIPYLKAAVEQDKIRSKESKKYWKQREKEERIMKERVRIRQKRAEKAKSIIEDIRLFERAETMRKFCDIAAQRTQSEEYKQAIDVARSVADWIDPTTDYVDEILAERYKATDFM